MDQDHQNGGAGDPGPGDEAAAPTAGAGGDAAPGPVPLAVVDPAAVGRPPSGRSRAALAVAVVVLVALVAGAVVVAVSRRDGSVDAGGPGGLQPLALLPSRALAVPSGLPASYPGTPPDLGASGPVSVVRPVDVDEARFTDMARAFGVEGTPTDRGNGSWTVTGNDGTGSFGVLQDGGATQVAMSSGRAPGRGAGEGAVPVPTTVAPPAGVSDAPPPGLPAPLGSPDARVEPPGPGTPSPALAAAPSAEEAESIVRSLLDRAGVLAGPAWEAEVEESGMAASAGACRSGAAACPAPVEVVTHRTVVLRPVVDGTPVTGLGWSVTVAAGGEVAHAQGVLGQPERVADYPLASVAEVVSDLAAGRARPVTGHGGVAFGRPVTDGPTSTGATSSGAAGMAEPPATTVPAPVTTVPGSATTVPTSATTVPVTTVPGAAEGAPPSGEAPCPLVHPPPPGCGGVEPPQSGTLAAPGQPAGSVVLRDARRGLGLVAGVDDGRPVAYLVPTYAFRVDTPGSAGPGTARPTTIEVVAVDPSLLTSAGSAPSDVPVPGSAVPAVPYTAPAAPAPEFGGTVPGSAGAPSSLTPPGTCPGGGRPTTSTTMQGDTVATAVACPPVTTVTTAAPSTGTRGSTGGGVPVP